jgi:3-methyladenine DNA glycosylase Mpg
VEWSPRIGIRVGIELEWRCCWKGHAALSVPTTRALRALPMATLGVTRRG